MKVFMKKAEAFLLAFVFVISILFGNAETAQAASKPEFCSDSYEFMFIPEWQEFGLGVGNLSKKAKVTVSVDKKSTATAKWDKLQSTAWVKAKKPGTVKVTIQVKQNGKTYKHTTKMKWVKYTNPLKSLQIGSKKYAVKHFNENTQAEMKKVSGSKVVKIKLKTGYEITSLGFSRNGVYKNIKNGNKIKFSKAGGENTVLFINYKDPKGNQGTLRLFAGNRNGVLL